VNKKDTSWAARFERAARNSRLPNGIELTALAEAAQEMVAPAQEIVEAAGEIVALVELLSPESGADRTDRAAARDNLREQAGKLGAALRELDGVMSW
jgi:hypothetical protein